MQNKLFEEYDRIYHNYDSCLKCLENILLIVKVRGDRVIANQIEKCLKELN